MMRKQVTLFVYIGIVLAACAPIANSPSPMSLTDTEAIETSPPPMASITPLARSAIFSPTATLTPLPMPTVASLKAQVTADLLSCRYGPGADYLYLFALRKTANIQLVGRVDEDNWKWALVENRPTPCWVNTNYLNMAGDLLSLPVVYPDYPRLPRSPYYPPTVVTKVVRDGTQVKIVWLEIPLRAGDEEDQFMQHYIIEVWHCVNGQTIFDPLATNDTSISFMDEPGCSQASHGRIFVQEKHGFAGPTGIPWPPYPVTTSPPTP